MLPAVVRRDPPGTDGVSDQEATRRGRNALRERTHLPSGKVCGQDPQEALFGKIRHKVRNDEKRGRFLDQETKIT